MKLIFKSLNRYYHSMQGKYPATLWFGNEERREIALTFDDGPHPRDTPKVLDVLAKYQASATFFLIGKHIESHPDIVKQIRQQGHQLGIHCHRHRAFPLENPQTLHDQLSRTQHRIAEVCVVSADIIRDVRPPYGLFTSRTLSLLIAWQYQIVMWNSIPAHWMQPLHWTINEVFEVVAPGSIIVLHDGHGHGSKVAQILETIIPELKSQGFHFITIEQMRQHKEMVHAE